MTTRSRIAPGCILVTIATLVLAVVCGGRAVAAEATVGLGTATSFAVLAGSTVTNTGPSVISGDLGVSPGSAITGFTGPPQGTVVNGTIHATDAVAAQAQSDVTIAYVDAANRSTTETVTANLGGQSLAPGVYTGALGVLNLTGTVTLNAGDDPDAVFIFQAGSTLTTASGSRVALNGVDPCNVFWQVGSSATLGTNSNFVGTILALTSITATTGATVNGRLLARNGAVTLDSNVITEQGCDVLPASTTTTLPATTTSTAPDATTSTIPGSTTSTLPAVTTTLPAGTTTLPLSTTTLPATATTVRPSATTLPATATTVRTSATTSPGGSATTTPTGATNTTVARTTATTRSGQTTTGQTTTGVTTADDGSTSRRVRTTSALPQTGSNLAGLAAFGMLALVIGATLVIGSRRPTGAAHLRR